MAVRALDRDRFRGALIGLAVGDALGTTIEFKPPGTFTPVTDITGGGPFDLPKGAWTDDTSMALCLAESLVERGGFNPVDQLQRYVRWYRDGYLSSTGAFFDIGNATAAALRRFERTGEPYPGDASPDAGGNGVLMKLAPVPMAYAAHPDTAIALAANSARTTHWFPAALDATRYLAALLVDALHGADREAVLNGDGHAGALRCAGTLHPEVQEVADGSYRRKTPPAITGGFYSVPALEAALWALHSHDDFASGALAAVNLGDDADTTGAIYGQLAGAVYGLDAIPAHWRETIVMGDEILALADALHDLAHTIEPAAPLASTTAHPSSPVLNGDGPDVPAANQASTTALPLDTYWVEEGRILAGPYAGAPTKHDAEKKLRAFLAAGVTTFVDLTEERDRLTRLEPYSHLLKLIAAEMGIAVTHLRLPIDDMDVPPPWRMRVILDAIRTAADAGETVYVHCWGGVGRTGTVVGCWLRENGSPSETVLAEIEALRAMTPKAKHRPAPENDRQRTFVTEWST
jgi:ADP-ribosyl-[dinitrogen reductase] hydrolase